MTTVIFLNNSSLRAQVQTSTTVGQSSINTKNNKNNTSKLNIGKGIVADAPQSSPLLEISGTVAKQLEKQRRGWSVGHVRRVLRCRPNLIQRVIGRNGVGINSIVVRD